MNHTATLTLTALFISTSSVALADTNAVELNMLAQEQIIVKDDKGHMQTKRVKPTSVIPGDTIVYTTQYTNHGKETATQVLISNEIAKEMNYIAGSADTPLATVSYSIDGGVSFAAEQNLSITDKDGKSHPATASDYTHIRWQITEIIPNGQGSVSYMAKVKEN